jgi:hypothetical protein
MADPAHPDTQHDVANVTDSDQAASRSAATPPNVCTLPRLRRELREFKTSVSSTLTFFRGRSEGRKMVATEHVWAAIAEAAFDLPASLLLDRSDGRIKPVIEDWLHGKRPELSVYAEDNVELLFRTVHAAIAALSRLEAVGYPAPPNWSNLPPAMLARQVNAFFEARTQQLAAWKDGD